MNGAEVKLLAYGYVSPGIIAMGIVGDIMSLRVLSHSYLARGAIFRFLYYLAFSDLLSFLSVMPMLLFMIGVRSCGYLAAFYYARLGLPLAKHIVEDVHGGRLTVESEEGQGSTFKVTLPNAGQLTSAAALC